MKIYSGYANYVPANTTKTLHNGNGKVWCIVASAPSGSGCNVTLYDNTSAIGNILGVFYVTPSMPLILMWPESMPVYFSTGLTVVTTTTVAAHLVTGA